MGFIFSPMPLTHAVPPFRQNGISAPNRVAILINCVSDRSHLKVVLSHIRSPAALLLPPPKPAPWGIFLIRVIVNPTGM